MSSVSKDVDGFTFICNISSLTDEQGKRFFINDADIAVFKIKEEVFVVSNICPHQQSALIYDGFIEDGCVICPAHGWMFNLRTGHIPGRKTGLKTFPVKILGDEIYSRVYPSRVDYKHF